MQLIILRHLSGSLAGQTTEIPEAQFTEITFGRNTKAGVRYEEEDDIVSTNHARLKRDPSDPVSFLIEDTGSSNGTYVDKRRIGSPMRLRPGNKVQFGVGGPEWEFDLDPRPNATRVVETVKPTRQVETVTVTTDPTAVPIKEPPPGVSYSPPAAPSTPAPTSSSRTWMPIAAVIGLLIVGGIAAWQFLPKNRSKVPSPEIAQTTNTNPPPDMKRPTQIYDENSQAVVRILLRWHLIYGPKGRSLYHLYVPIRNRQKAPLYVNLDGNIEPVLTFSDGQGLNEPISGSLDGSGFIVSSDGFILTCKHVASPWKSVYKLPSGWLWNGLLGKNFSVQPISAPNDWTPAHAKWVEEQRGHRINVDDLVVTGSRDAFEVAFKKNKDHTGATWVRDSTEHDVSLIKIQSPETFPKVEITDSLEDPKVSDPVHVIAYSGMGMLKSSKLNDNTSLFQIIEDNKPAQGIVQSVERRQKDVYSDNPDTYQLDITSLGPGSSGGPVFDSKGKVIAIFFARSVINGTTSTYAVPIRYGRNIMGNSTDIK